MGKGKVAAGGINVARWFTRKWGDYPELSVWAGEITRIPEWERERHLERVRGRVTLVPRSDIGSVAGFEDGGRGLEPRNVRDPRNKKRQDNGPPARASGEEIALPSLGLSAVRLGFDSRSVELRGDMSVWWRLPSWWPFVTAALENEYRWRQVGEDQGHSQTFSNTRAAPPHPAPRPENQPAPMPTAPKSRNLAIPNLY